MSVPNNDWSPLTSASSKSKRIYLCAVIMLYMWNKISLHDSVVLTEPFQSNDHAGGPSSKYTCNVSLSDVGKANYI